MAINKVGVVIPMFKPRLTLLLGRDCRCGSIRPDFSSPPSQTKHPSRPGRCQPDSGPPATRSTLCVSRNIRTRSRRCARRCTRSWDQTQHHDLAQARYNPDCQSAARQGAPRTRATLDGRASAEPIGRDTLHASPAATLCAGVLVASGRCGSSGSWRGLG